MAPHLPERRFGRRVFLAGLSSCGFLIACGGMDEPQPAPTTAPLPTHTPRTATPAATATPTTPPNTASASPTVPAATPTEVATQAPVTRLAPVGFPVEESVRTGIVRGDVGARAIAWGEGPAALAYSRDDQPSPDPVRANAAGWNARVHVEYEGRPAVDWYLPPGTPISSTMDGVATLYAVTVDNPFDYYGVSREAYVGNPDRSRAPITPFPGPGGGMGILVRVENAQYRSDYGHMEVVQTGSNVPAGAWHAGYSPASLASQFAALRSFNDWTAVASWQVERGDLIGFTGDTGYSEAPHLHYAISRTDGSPLSPTDEPGVADGGWLFLDQDP